MGESIRLLNRRNVRRVARAFFGALGLFYVLVAIRRAWLEGQINLPSSGLVGLSLVLVTIGLLGAGVSWATLFERPAIRGRLIASFLVSQVAKYAPGGGISQAMGQIALASDENVSGSQAGARFFLHAGVQTVAMATVAGLMFFDVTRPGLVRGLFLCGLLSPLLLSPRWMSWILDRVSSLMKRRPLSPGFLPSQRSTLVSALWALAPVLTSGLVFALIAHELDPGVQILTAVLAYPAAWIVGYFAIPFPAGIGVREAVLVALVPASAGVVITASLTHRLVTMAGELILLVASWRRSR